MATLRTNPQALAKPATRTAIPDQIALSIADLHAQMAIFIMKIVAWQHAQMGTIMTMTPIHAAHATLYAPNALADLLPNALNAIALNCIFYQVSLNALQLNVFLVNT